MPTWLNFTYTDQTCFIIDHSVSTDSTVSNVNIQTDADLHVYESEHSSALPAEHGTEKGNLNARNKCLVITKEITNHMY